MKNLLLPAKQSGNRSFLLRHFTLVTLFILLGAAFQKANAQVPHTDSYQFIADSTGQLAFDRNGNQVDFSGTPYLIEPGVQQSNSLATPLPFAVSFMGTAYTHFLVNTNGCMVMAPSSVISFTAAMPNSFSSVNNQLAIFAPFWDALNTPLNQGIKYKVLGTEPFRVLVVEWNTSAPSSRIPSSGDMRFQCRLYETTNIVEYIYGEMKIGDNTLNPVTATIGFSTVTAARDGSFMAITDLDSLTITRSVSGLAATTQLVNSKQGGAIRALHSSGEGSRKRFAFVPLPMNAPTNLGAFNIESNNALLYWDDNADDELGYRVYRIKNNQYIPDTTVAPNITFRTANNLLAGTDYRYRVLVYNNYTAAFSNTILFTTAAPRLVTAKASGNWDDTATWGGIVPGKNDSVVIPAGIKVNINIGNAICHQLNIEGELEYANNSVIKKLTVNYDLLNNGKFTAARVPSFNSLSNELVIGRRFINNNVADLFINPGSYSSGIALRFNGEDQSYLTGNGDNTDLYTLVMEKKSSTDSVVITTAKLTIKNFATDAESGSALLSNAAQTGTLYLGGSYTLENRIFPTTIIGLGTNPMSVIINNPGFTLKAMTGDFTLSSKCSLSLVKGFVNFQGSLSLSLSSELHVSGGTLTIGNTLRNASSAQAVFVSLTGGKIITNGLLLNAPTNSVNFAGGLLIVNGNAQLLADKNRSFFGNTQTQLGYTDGNALKQFTLSGIYTNLVIDSAINNNTVVKASINAATELLGTAYIGHNDSLLLGAFTLTLNTDSLIVNGALQGTNPASKLLFRTENNQYISGSGSISVGIIETDKADTTRQISLATSNTIEVTDLQLSGGKITRASKLKIGNGSGRSGIRIGKSDAFRDAGYLDEAPVFSANDQLYVYYFTELNKRISGYEIPASRKLAGLFMANKTGLKIEGGPLEVTDTLRLDSGVIETSIANELIFSDTTNYLALSGGNNLAYINGPFTRFIAAGNHTNKLFFFPSGNETYRPLVISNVLVNNESAALRVWAANEKPEGQLHDDLLKLDSNSGYWQVKVVKGLANLAAFKTSIYHNNLMARSRVALAKNNAETLRPSDLFTIAGTRVNYYTDSLLSVNITPSTGTDSSFYFAVGEAKPDTIYAGTYTIGEGEDYTNLTALADALANNLVDGKVTFEITKNYDAPAEIFPLGFEQTYFTTGQTPKDITIKLANNVTNVVMSNGTKAMPSSNALVNFYGADYLTFDGRGFDALGLPTGSMEWVFKTETTLTPVIRFANDASFNRITNLDITGNNTNLLSGTIVFSNTAKSETGNDNNHIASCRIGSAATWAGNHIFATGTETALNDGNTISDNTFSNFSGSGILVSGSGNGSGWNISNNSFYQTIASANANTAINFIPGKSSGNNTISFNTIGGSAAQGAGAQWSYSGTAIISMMQVSADTQALAPTVIEGNRIKNFYGSGTGTAAGFRAISLIDGSIILSSNTIGGSSVQDSVSIMGRGVSSMIYSTVPAGGFLKLSDNIITNVHQRSTGATSTRLRAIAHEGSGKLEVSNNTIINLSSQGVNTTFTDPSLAGIYIASASAGMEIRANRISNLNMLFAGCVGAICVNTGNGKGTIAANLINDLRSATATAGRNIMGINVETGSWNIYNNKVSLSNTGNEARGAKINGIRFNSPATDKSYIAYNSVYIGGSTSINSTSAASFAYEQVYNATASVLNNVFVNARTALTAVAPYQNALFIFNGSTLASSSLDFNLYYSVSPGGLARLNTSNITYAGYRSLLPIQDVSSVAGMLPAFMNADADLNLKDTLSNCILKGAGAALPFIITDEEGDARGSSQTDLGADEFTYTKELPLAPVFISGNDTLCSGESRILLVNTATEGADIEWYTQPSGGSPVFTGTDFETGALTSDTAFYAQTISETCKSSRIKIQVAVKPVAQVNVLNAPSSAICSGNALTLKAAASTGAFVEWFSDSTATSLIATGTEFKTGALTSDTSFYIKAANGICPPVIKKISIAVNAQVSLSAPVTDTLVEACRNTNVELKATGTPAVNWFASPTSTTAIGSDSIFTLLNITRDTTLYVASVESSCESERVKVTVTVFETPVLPAIDSVITACASAPLHITGTITRGSLNWFASEQDMAPFYTGDTLTIASVEQDTVYYYEMISGPCASSQRKAVYIKAIPVIIPEFNVLNTICANRSVQLEVLNADTNTVRWFTSANSIEPLFTGSSLTTGLLTADTSFYAQISSAGCSSERKAISIDVAEAPVAPTLISVDSICKGGTSTITINSTQAVQWYSSLQSTEVISTDLVFAPAQIQNDSVFYVAAVYGNCLSNRLAVKVKTKVSSLPPVIIPVDPVCSGQSVTLQVTASDSVKWFNSLNATTVLAQGNSFTTPKLSTGTTYYLENTNGVCKSARVPFAVAINPLPSAPVVLETAYRTCFNEGVTLKASSSNTINWYGSPASQVLLVSDSVFTSDRLKTDTVFYAESYNGACRSARVSIPVTVLNYIGNLDITVPDSVTIGEEITITASGLASSIYAWEFGKDASLSGATGFGPFNVSYSSAGEKTVSLVVSRRSGTLICDTVMIRRVMVYDTTTTGLNDHALNYLDFNAYPNPASDVLNIGFKLDRASDAIVQLIDANGREVWNDRVSRTTTYHHTINTRELGKGLFIVRVMAGSGVQTRKIIIR